jgi:hypothetical protein
VVEDKFRLPDHNLVRVLRLFIFYRDEGVLSADFTRNQFQILRAGSQDSAERALDAAQNQLQRRFLGLRRWLDVYVLATALLTFVVAVSAFSHSVTGGTPSQPTVTYSYDPPANFLYPAAFVLVVLSFWLSGYRNFRTNLMPRPNRLAGYWSRLNFTAEDLRRFITGLLVAIIALLLGVVIGKR